MRFVVTAAAVAEALFVEDDIDGERVRVPVDVPAWEKTGEIGVVPLDPAKLTLFVSLTRDWDDGEATTLALARSRGYLVVTDDRKAVRTADHHGCAVLGTAGLLRQWAQAVGLPSADIGMVLRRVERRARFPPRRHDPDHDWWTRCTAAC